MKKIIPFFFIFFFYNSKANDFIKVRILSNLKLKSFFFSPDKGSSYSIFGNGKIIYTLHDSETVQLKYEKDSSEVWIYGKRLGYFSLVKINSNASINTFRIKCTDPERKTKYYQDNLIIAREINSSSFKLINVVDLEGYIAGVVEAEAGRKSHSEFYKAQAILARTYALSIIGKHVIEGHDLCDQVHCQAFFGRTFNTPIQNAVKNTKGIVVVDEDMNLIDAVFHSNSGGQTANAEDVWGKPKVYLKSVNDSFSINMPNYSWERKMATEDWLTYLKIKHNFPIEDSVARIIALNFSQENRKNYIEHQSIKVPLKNIRNDLSLKSTFFSITADNDTIIFRGKGYGHGIGMCQEGAMKMAEKGYSYVDVIHFYYKGVRLIERTQLAFFREEG